MNKNELRKRLVILSNNLDLEGLHKQCALIDEVIDYFDNIEKAIEYLSTPLDTFGRDVDLGNIPDSWDEDYRDLFLKMNRIWNEKSAALKACREAKKILVKE